MTDLWPWIPVCTGMTKEIEAWVVRQFSHYVMPDARRRGHGPEPVFGHKRSLGVRCWTPHQVRGDEVGGSNCSEKSRIRRSREGGNPENDWQ